MEEHKGALAGLDEELVPLRVAARVAYFHVTDEMRQVRDQEELADIIHIVAIALSTVAPILRLDGAELSGTAIRDLLYRPLGDRNHKPDLDALSIRRGELRRALVTLKQARIVFDRRR